MTVAELLRELQEVQPMRAQYLPVLVMFDASQIFDSGALYEWAEIDDVRDEGARVVVKLKP